MFPRQNATTNQRFIALGVFGSCARGDFDALDDVEQRVILPEPIYVAEIRYGQIRASRRPCRHAFEIVGRHGDTTAARNDDEGDD